MRHLLIEQMPHFILGNTAQFVGSVGDAFSAICCLQIFRFTSSKPSKSAIASDEKFIRLRTNSFVRYCPCFQIKQIRPQSAARLRRICQPPWTQPLRRKPRSPAGGTTSVKAHTFIPSHSSGGGPGEGLLLEKPPSPESSSLCSQLLLRCRERDGEGRADAGLAADTDFSAVCNYNNACNAQA